MRIYLDSSALAKVYIRENGTEEVLGYCEQASEVILSCVSVPEIISALNRRHGESVLSSEQYKNIKKEFFLDIEDASIIDLSPSIVQISVTCLEKSSLRALDAIHVASAKESYCDLFVSSDFKQYKAAKQLNLKCRYVGSMHE